MGHFYIVRRERWIESGVAIQIKQRVELRDSFWISGAQRRERIDAIGEASDNGEVPARVAPPRPIGFKIVCDIDLAAREHCPAGVAEAPKEIWVRPGIERPHGEQVIGKSCK